MLSRSAEGSGVLLLGSALNGSALDHGSGTLLSVLNGEVHSVLLVETEELYLNGRANVDTCVGNLVDACLADLGDVDHALLAGSILNEASDILVGLILACKDLNYLALVDLADNRLEGFN